MACLSVDLIAIILHNSVSPFGMQIALIRRHRSLMIENSFKSETKKVPLSQDEIVDRMEQVRSSGLAHVSKLHGDAKQLTDWKAYAKASPLVSVAVVSLIGFSAARQILGQTAKKGSSSISPPQPILSNVSTSGEWKNRAIAIATQFAHSTLQKYVSGLIQRHVTDRSSNDPVTQSKSRFDINGSEYAQERDASKN
jgi:hypothetical protein